MKTVFNLKAKYILLAKEIKASLKIKYIISDYDGNIRKISEEDTIDLAKNGKLANCTFDEGLKGLGMSLRHLPTYDKNTGVNYRDSKEQEIIDSVLEYRQSKLFTINKRIMIGKQCIGYELQNSSGQTSKFKRSTVISMIHLGYIPSVSYQYYTNTHFIKGIGFNVNKLESITLNTREDIRLI